MKSLKEQSLATFDKILTPTWLALLSSFPEIQMPLMVAYGFYWVVMQYKQNELNEFIQFIQDNPESFTKDIVNTNAFKDWFIIILEEYLKERNQEKRNIIKNIFLWFTQLSAEKKKKFQLERLLDITSKITVSEIWLLREINDKWSINFKSKEKSWIIYWNPFVESIDFFNLWKKILKNTDIHSSWEQYIDLRYWLMSLWIIKQIDMEEASKIPDNNNKKDFLSIELTKLWELFISYILKNES